MKPLLLLSSLLVSATLFAQSALDWSYSFGQPSGVETPINGSATDSNGNVLVTGFIYTGTPVDMEPGVGTTNMTSTDQGDVYVAKYSKAGALLWVKTLDGTNFQTGQNIGIDNNGNIILTGTLRGTVDMDPGAGVANLTATTLSGSGFVAKYDSLMNHLWSFEIPTGSNSFSVVNDIAIDANNNISIVGGFQNTVSLDPLSAAGDFTAPSAGGFVAKYTPSGAHDFSFSLVDFTNPTDGRAYGLDVDSDNNLYVFGAFRDSIDCDPNGGLIVRNSTNRAGYIAKYSPSGSPIWAIPIGTDGAGNISASSIEIDNSDNLIICGTNTTGDYDFDPSLSSALVSGFGSYDAFVAKYDSTGNYDWAFNIGGTDFEVGRDLAINAQNEIFVTGVTRADSIDFDPSANDGYSVVVELGAFSSDFIAKYSSNGDYEWSYIPADDDNEFPPYVAVYDTIVYMTGSAFVMDMDWDSITAPLSYSINQGYIFKIGDESCTPTAPMLDLASLPDLTGECSVSVPTAPTASNCLGTFSGIPDVTFPITTQGTTMVTWTYDDGNGNTSTQTQNVVVEDVTAPVPDNNTLTDVTGECEITSLTPPTASDNCLGSVTVTNDATLPINTQGTTVVTWTYDDGNGNTSTQTQNVVITDVTAPVPDVNNLVDYSDECPVELATIGGTPTATDNCSGAINGTPDVTFPITASGTTTITWTYDDGNGNMSTQTQDVTITPIDNGITQVDAVTLSADASAAAYTYQWVDCDNGNAPVNGATNQTFTPTVAGSYACIIENGFCTVTTACLASSVGILENSFGIPLTLFPNPTDGDFSIDLGENTQLATVTMTDLSGKVIQSTRHSSEQLLNLKIEEPAGVYLLVIESGDKKAVIRLVKE